MRKIIRHASCAIPLALSLALAISGHAEQTGAAGPEDAPQSMKEALERLQLPGIKINLDEWSIDVDATVSLEQGMLELVACAKDTKEHESIVAVNAKPSHIHTALLLIGANPGNPAMRRIFGEGEEARIIDMPPRGGMIDVYLVLESPDGPKEVPINRFIQKSIDYYDLAVTGEEKPDEREFYPTHSFMFTGSVLVERDEEGPRQYVADYSGNVISLVTFGDEMMGTPKIHDDANQSLVWEVRSEDLPELDSKVILRLKPQRPEPDEAGE